MKSHILRSNPSKDDDSWKFVVPQEALIPPQSSKTIYGKFIKFSSEVISFQMERFPSNRILHADDPSTFILLSFVDLRFPDSTQKATAEYIARLMQSGLYLNSIQYRFYHHSNSQLRGRSCFLRRAETDAELDDRIYKFGDFGKIMNIAKRAKRIGLLFSEAQIDYQLDPRYTADIPDIKVGNEIFSDGCGLISKQLSIWLSKAKKIIFRGRRYTPCVFQIRYLGYKGVLMLHPDLDKEKTNLVQFRQSMKKFSTTENTTFSVVDHSSPYAFGRLNNDIIVLLSSLGISNEKLLAKQESYFQWITGASEDLMKAIDFLSCMGQYPLAERVLLDGLENPDVSKAIRKIQLSEIASFRNKRDKHRARMMIHKSRLIFGVCDPFRVLKEGEVHIRITASHKGPTTPIHGDVLVVRNPCLHPGDCLKLRAVQHNKLAHLVDCVVFASVALPGHQAAPAMSSGGDLDGDKYFVCWDPDLVPARVAESYDYPPNKEHVSKHVTRADLANHFASYNNSGLARVAALHQKWVRSSPKGALSSECQELNALHSQSVDGARIRIPDRLINPPETTVPYIIDLLAEAASEFANRFIQTVAQVSRTSLVATNAEEGRTLLVQLLQSDQNALSEYELFTIAYRLARKHSFDIRPFLSHFDLGAFTTEQKYAINSTLFLRREDEPIMWNSLFRSDILKPRELYQRRLNQPFSLQRLYSSKIHGLATFFRYLRMAMEEYTRKLLIIKTDDRFAIGIFIRGQVHFDDDGDETEFDDSEVDENVVVCSFMPQASAAMSTYRPCTVGYRLHCSRTNLQLYNKRRADTFVFITRPPAASGTEIATSIALQKISSRVQQQVGRVNRTAVAAIELHVVSNRDRVGHQLFDLWFEHVPTEEYIGRFDREVVPYHLNDMTSVNWETYPQWLKGCFDPKQNAESMRTLLMGMNSVELDQIMVFSVKNHLEEELFWTFDAIITQLPLRHERIAHWMNKYPPLAFAFLKAYPPNDSQLLPPDCAALDHSVIRNLIKSANRLGMATLVALEKIAGNIAQLSLEMYLDLLMLAALCVRSQQLVQEVLLVLHDSRIAATNDSVQLQYAHKNALAVAFDRAEEAADECPCNEEGKPRKQRTPPTLVKLSFVPDKPTQAAAAIRVDARTAVRLHSHVRLQAASHPENQWIEAPILDGVVVQASRGEMKIELLYPPPPEMELMDWKMYNAGSTATSKAMMDALLRLAQEGSASCRFHRVITGQVQEGDDFPMAMDNAVLGPADLHGDEKLNPSQAAAVESYNAPLSLIWGPPGTGKTTVVVQILLQFLRNSPSDVKILMTASTHNAVDNVLERFVKANKTVKMLAEEHILRVATDQSKVNKALQSYTIDARVGGDMNENNKLFKRAQQRVNDARIVFTTCAGAGLGILRKADFDIALIDEASQVTEPCALIPLVKGIRRAVLVGDHVQLRPTVGRMAKALEFDISLLERLYSGGQSRHVVKTMLNVQYRFPKEIANFPSREFYGGKLQTGSTNAEQALSVLRQSSFPWPRGSSDGIVPTVFVQCSAEEELGGVSKCNIGQAELVARIIPMLKLKDLKGNDQSDQLSVTVLSPYSKQVQTIHGLIPIRCNAEADIGFVEDSRRLNVMWTRAKLGLIIIGDRRTMCERSGLWNRAIASCTEVLGL